MMYKYYLGLGSNIEPRYNFLQNAICELNYIGEIKKKSGIYESLPWGNTDQNKFLNAVVRFYSELDPFNLLSKIKIIEQRIGRKHNREKWGPREIDIDILFSDNIFIRKDVLKIPHEQFKNRNFVLVPMAELNSNYRPEYNGMDIKYFLDNKTDQSVVRQTNISWLI